MTDENAAYDVVEARLDGDLIAEARLPGDVGVVEAGADAPAVPDPILGATPAESPDEAPAEVSVEAPREKIARLLSEGYKLSRLVVTTDAKGTPIDVKIA